MCNWCWLGWGRDRDGSLRLGWLICLCWQSDAWLSNFLLLSLLGGGLDGLSLKAKNVHRYHSQKRGWAGGCKMDKFGVVAQKWQFLMSLIEQEE